MQLNGRLLLLAAALLVLGAGALLELRVPERSRTSAQQQRAESMEQLPWGSSLFCQFHGGARRLLRGQNPYDELAGCKGRTPGVQLNHPPTSLLPYLLVASLPLSTAAAVSAGMSMALLWLAAFLWAGQRLQRSAWRMGVGLAAWLVMVPSWRLLTVGQNTAWLLAALSLGFVALERKKDGLAGVALALSLLKPHLAFVPLCCAAGMVLAGRRWRVLLWGLATLLLMVLAVWWLAPSSFADYLVQLRFVSPQGAYLPDNLTGRGVLALGGGFRRVAWGLFALGAVVAFWGGRSQSGRFGTAHGGTAHGGMAHGGMAHGGAVAIMASAALMPHAFDYDLVLTMPLTVQLVTLLGTERRRALVGLLAWLPVNLVILWAHRQPWADLSCLWWVSWWGVLLSLWCKAGQAAPGPPEHQRRQQDQRLQP